MPRRSDRRTAAPLPILGLALVAMMFFAGSLEAAISDAAACRDTVAKAARNATAKTVNARARCLKQRMRFKLGAGVDCMADPPALGGAGSGDAKTDEGLTKLLKIRDRQNKKIVKKCDGLDLQAVGVSDVCTPAASSAAELAECVVLELGKVAGDALSALIDVPQPAAVPGEGARKCFEIINRGLRFNERKLNLMRGACFSEAEKTAGSFDGCLATVAPPGIVASTGYPDIDEALAKRLRKFRGHVFNFCTDIDFDSLGFDAVITDRTAPPLTLDDVFNVLYDALLDEVTTINAAVYPSVPYCGDGATSAGEECDDGNRFSCDGCDRDCSLAACGNGAACSPELCDDGNSVSGDGCDPTCVSEVCGNGVVQPGIGEECDDGVGNSDVLPNACRSDCRLPSCGDGVVDTGEACDPPNGSTCEANCTSPNCGDGVIDPGEECDDGDANNSDTTPDACRVDCTNPTCGDGVVDPGNGETCDPPDGGVTCQADCTLALCGNGALDPGEECDDGAGNSDTVADACRTDCTSPSCGDGVVDSGETCDASGQTASCDSDCTLPVCGDGTLNSAAGEVCDDGGVIDGDGCDSNCTPTGCGNGVVTSGELCDDGNTVGGDGCSAVCDCGGETACGNPDPQCPGKGELVIFSGTTTTSCTNNADCSPGVCNVSLSLCQTVTELDTGWTGIAHDADINDLLTTVGNLFCPGPAPTCGECAVIGVNPETGSCRCSNDNRAICDEPFVADADDCGGNVCDCYLGAPLPLSAGNTPACVLNRFADDLSGTADVDTGAGLVDTSLKSVVHLGESLILPCPACGGTCTAPAPAVGDTCATFFDCDTFCSSNSDCVHGGTCPPGGGTCGDGVCDNYDATPDDGVRGGVCHTGDNAGETCDITGVSSSFPAPGGILTGPGMSLDCFPDAAKNVSGLGLDIVLSQTTGAQQLTAEVLCGFPEFGIINACHCGVCSGGGTFPCSSDGDCPSPQTCERVEDGAPMPNQCSAGVCNDAGGGEGVCDGGPTDKLCDGVVRGSGDGFIACANDAECQGGAIGINAGLCTLTKDRECFLDTIVASGSADPSTPVGAAIFCIPPTSNPGINEVAGLPGPGRVINQGRARTFCASNPAIEYVPGAGGCP